MNKKYKIVVVGLGYVGLSNAVLLAQHHEVIGVDIHEERVKLLNCRQSPIVDTELEDYLKNEKLNFSASTDLSKSVLGADFVIVSTPTNYDESKNFFDTSIVEKVISDVILYEPRACIVVKSTLPIGFTESVSSRLGTTSVIFSPEFLREGKALYDNLYPSRIVVGEKSERAKTFAELLARASLKDNVNILLTGSREAEALKLFSNSYLAMRVAFFNELDNFALANNLISEDLVKGICADPRIGDFYNNPSFGYGGYCLPKDTKQLQSNYQGIPQKLITATIQSNYDRAEFMAQYICKSNPEVVGVYGLSTKVGSDNYRMSSVINVTAEIQKLGIKVICFDTSIKNPKELDFEVISELSVFKKSSDIIIANRLSPSLDDVRDKVFTRDLFGHDI